MNKPKSWLWPDGAIGKKESRILREEHNAVVNSHADMSDALWSALTAYRQEFENDEPIGGSDFLAWFSEWREANKGLLDQLDKPCVKCGKPTDRTLPDDEDERCRECSDDYGNK